MMEQRLQSGLAALNLPVEGIPALVRYGDLPLLSEVYIVIVY